MFFHSDHHPLIEINPQPLGKGGEGNVHEIIQPQVLRNYVVKIYHPKEQKPERQAKLNYLIQHRPTLRDDFSVIWPEELVFQEGKFAGFLMKKARGNHDLTVLAGLKPSRKLSPDWREKYNRSHVSGFIHLAKVCYNVAAAIDQLHQTGRYVLVDIKPENIKISYNGNVSLIDIDSIEVMEGQELIFPAEKLSSEYSPAELRHLDFKQDLIPESWDRFSMAVVFYKVLFGLHPFAGTVKPNYGNLVSHEQKIQAGYFPNGSLSGCFQVVPRPHQNFQALSPRWQELFLRCFDRGYLQPDCRPKAEEWCQQLEHPQIYTEKYRNPYPKPRPVRKPKSAPNPAPKPIYLAQHRENSLIAAICLILILFSVIFFMPQHRYHYRSDYDLDFKLPEETDYHLDFNDEILPSKNALYKYYDEVEDFYEGRARVKKDGKYGYIDQHGRLITPVVYEDAVKFFYQNKASVMLHGTWFYINEEGQCIENCPDYLLESQNGRSYQQYYDYVGRFNHGLAKVRLGHLWGFINVEGRAITPIQYEEVDDFYQGLARVRREGRYGFLDRTGKEIIRPEYDYISRNFHEGITYVMLHNKYGFVDMTGKTIAFAIYDEVRSFQSGVAPVRLGEKWGLIDREGKILTLFMYDEIRAFHEGLAAVKLHNQYGFVNTAGEMVIPTHYEEAKDFKGGWAFVKREGNYLFIDHSGHCVGNCSENP